VKLLGVGISGGLVGPFAVFGLAQVLGADALQEDWTAVHWIGLVVMSAVLAMLGYVVGQRDDL
jgi:drug/metabolite transporter (DMT)-like permease